MASPAPMRPFVRAAPAFLASTMLLGAHQIERRLRSLDDRDRDRYARAWSIAVLRSLAVHVHVLGAAKMKSTAKHGVRLIVANHRSALDTLVLQSIFGGSMLARGDMERWPILGPLARIGDTIFVDRADPNSGARAVLAMRSRLRRGRDVGIFPEGTTFAGDEVRPFHRGGFLAASRAGASVLPVGFAYASDDHAFTVPTMKEHMQKLLAADRIDLAICIGDSISAEIDSFSLMERSREEVRRLVARARGSFG